MGQIVVLEALLELREVAAQGLAVSFQGQTVCTDGKPYGGDSYFAGQIIGDGVVTARQFHE